MCLGTSSYAPCSAPFCVDKKDSGCQMIQGGHMLQSSQHTRSALHVLRPSSHPKVGKDGSLGKCGLTGSGLRALWIPEQTEYSPALCPRIRATHMHARQNRAAKLQELACSLFRLETDSRSDAMPTQAWTCHTEQRKNAIQHWAARQRECVAAIYLMRTECKFVVN